MWFLNRIHCSLVRRRSGPESVGEDTNLKSGRQVREKASEVDQVVGGKHKIVWGNLQAMTDYGVIFKNYQAKTGLLESKLSKNILVDCTFISSMQKIPLKQNWCQTIHKCYPWTPRPSSYTPALYINIVKHQLLKSDLFFFFFFYLNQLSAKKICFILT